MNKPSNKPKEITETFCGPICDLEEMTVKDVDTLLSYMRDKNIIKVFLERDYYGHDGGFNICPKQSRMETQEEADIRCIKESIQYEKEKERQKTLKEQQIEKLKKEAKKLGLNVS